MCPTMIKTCSWELPMPYVAYRKHRNGVLKAALICRICILPFIVIIAHATDRLSLVLFAFLFSLDHSRVCFEFSFTVTKREGEIYTLEQWIFLYNSYLKKKYNKSCKISFALSILVFELQLHDNFQICIKSAFNWVFHRQELHQTG
jgi:hypothetical protein